MENKKTRKESSLLAGLFSFLIMNRTQETNSPWMAANRKMVVQVSKEGCCISGVNVLQTYVFDVNPYKNLLNYDIFPKMCSAFMQLFEQINYIVGVQQVMLGIRWFKTNFNGEGFFRHHSKQIFVCEIISDG